MDGLQDGPKTAPGPLGTTRGRPQERPKRPPKRAPRGPKEASNMAPRGSHDCPTRPPRRSQSERSAKALMVDSCRRRRCRCRASKRSSSSSSWSLSVSSLLSRILLHNADQGNSPGDCFWMDWWGCAKRERFSSFVTLRLASTLRQRDGGACRDHRGALRGASMSSLSDEGHICPRTRSCKVSPRR